MKKNLVAIAASLLMISLLSWTHHANKNADSNTIVIYLEHTTAASNQENDNVYEKMKKQGEASGIKFYRHEWKSMEELNQFLSDNQLSIQAISGKKELSLTA